MSNPKRVLRQRYELFGTVGVGNFGKVFEGYDRQLGIKCAIKELFPEVTHNPEMMKITQMEVEVLKKIDHRYIIKLFDSFPENGTYYLVYEFCEKGDLKYNIDRKQITEQDALKIVYQMAEALCELKRHQIIHRDIKPENLFLTQDICKLGDFGLCFKGDRIQLSSSVGSLGFLAPETQLQLIYSSKADVYSLGICFYEMIHGDIPFNQSQIENLAQVKLNLKIERIPGVKVSDESLDLMRRMVDPNEQRRISCLEIRDLLAPRFSQYHIGREYESKGIHQIRRVSNHALPNTSVGITVTPAGQLGPQPHNTPPQRTNYSESLGSDPHQLAVARQRASETAPLLTQPASMHPLAQQQQGTVSQGPPKVAYKSYSLLPDPNSYPLVQSRPDVQPSMAITGPSQQQTQNVFAQKHHVPSRTERPSSEISPVFRQQDFINNTYQRSLNQHQSPSPYTGAQRDASSLNFILPIQPNPALQLETTQNRNNLNLSQQLAQPQEPSTASKQLPGGLGKSSSYFVNSTDLNTSMGNSYALSQKEPGNLQNQVTFSEYGHQTGISPTKRVEATPLKQQIGTMGYQGLSAGKRPHFSSMSSLFPQQSPQVSPFAPIPSPNFVPQFSAPRPSYQPEGSSPIHPAHLPRRPSDLGGYLADLQPRPPSPRRTANPATGLQIQSQPAPFAPETPPIIEERRISTSEPQDMQQVFRSPSVRREVRDQNPSPAPMMQSRSFVNPRFVQNTPMLEANSNVEVKSNTNFYLESPQAAPAEPVQRMLPKSFQPAGAPIPSGMSFGRHLAQVSGSPAPARHQPGMSNSQVLNSEGYHGQQNPQMASPQVAPRRRNPLETVFTEQKDLEIRQGHHPRSVSIDSTFYSRFHGVGRGPGPRESEEVNVSVQKTSPEAISASKGLSKVNSLTSGFEENKRPPQQPQFHDKILTREALHEMLQPRMTAPESGAGPSVRPFEISFRNAYKNDEPQSRATVGGSNFSGPRPSVNPLLSRVDSFLTKMGRDSSQTQQRLSEPLLAFNIDHRNGIVHTPGYTVTNKHF